MRLGVVDRLLPGRVGIGPEGAHHMVDEAAEAVALVVLIDDRQQDVGALALRRHAPAIGNGIAPGDDEGRHGLGRPVG